VVTLPGERASAYRIFRYSPNLVRDEWVNIGVLVFDPKTGERRLRLIEEQDEYNRVRRLHPQADETLLRALRDNLEDRFKSESESESANGSKGGRGDWQRLLGKWDDTLSNALQLAPQKDVFAADLDAELERLYADHVAPQPRPDALVLLAGFPASPPAGAHRKIRSRRGVYFPRRPHAFGLQLPPQRNARFRAGALRHARARRRQAAGLYRRAHRRKGFPENRICCRHRRSLERGK
jgi:hypothetical protein